MHICYVADARSPIAKNWISHFVARRDRVTIVTSYPSSSDEIPGTRIIEFPFWLSSLSRPQCTDNGSQKVSHIRDRLLQNLRGGKIQATSHSVRTLIAPFDVLRKARTLSALLDDLQPDLVHAMRLPFEGYLAAAAVKRAPLLLSVWGNDFTLFANRNRRLAALTSSALQRADGLHCDCNRDLNLAFAGGFPRNKPWRVLPGNGGVQEFFFKAVPDHKLLRQFRIPAGIPLVINPRGFRTYVHNEAFFKSIPLVLRGIPNAFFVATGMAGNPVAERWIRRMKITDSVRLLPVLKPEQLACMFAAAQISVSPSSHDGTPNTLLEAMAAGCLPIAGDIESVREWIVNGENGLLCDPADPVALAQRIAGALMDFDFLARAKQINRRIVSGRAEYRRVMDNAESFYAEILGMRRATALPLRSQLLPH